MRLLLTILLINCFTTSYSQSATQPVDSGRIFFANLFNFIKDNGEESTPVSIKQETLFNELRSVILRNPKDSNNFSHIAQCINLTYTQVQTLVSLVDTSVRNALWKAVVDNMMKRISAAETGRAFPPLTLTDTSGEELTISSLKGKVIYIDVWSSWCGPCREKLPEIRKINQEYNSKGLEIIGLSIDHDKQKWLKAIKEDNQTWKAYCELKQWSNNKFARRFSIYSIPANFLIDENGILVAQGISPGSLRSWLANHN